MANWVSPEVLEMVPPGWIKDSVHDEQIRRTILWMDVAYGLGRIDGLKAVPRDKQVLAPWEDYEAAQLEG